LEIPLEVTRELKAVSLPRVSPLGAMANYDFFLFFLPKQKTLLPTREDFGLFSSHFGICTKRY
jgi:hypothetical protein